MHLLFPLKIFQVRKKITKSKRMKEKNPKYSLLIKEIRDDILKVTKEILQHIDIIYNENKIDTSEYNEFAVVIGNLTMYLCQEVDKLEPIEEEVSNLFKTFYDPKVEERGIKIGEANGEKRGILKTQRELILDFLQDIGNIPDDIKTLVQKEVDLEKLKKWVKISARSQSIEDFRNKLDLH